MLDGGPDSYIKSPPRIVPNIFMQARRLDTGDLVPTDVNFPL